MIDQKGSNTPSRKLKLLIVSQYFWPENFRINDLARALQERGHEVSVLTGKPNYPGGWYFDGYGFWGRIHDEYCGIPVNRVPLLPRGRASRLGLVLNYLSFVVFGVTVGPVLCNDSYDAIIVCQLSPVTVAYPAIAVKKLTKTPILFWVLDLWPDSLSATGAVRSPWLIRAFGKIVKNIYSYCDRILVQSRAFIPAVERYAPSSKIRYFPSWAEDCFSGNEQAEAAPSLPGRFKIMFAGNIGVAQDFPSILSAAEILKDRSEIQWIIVGDGRMAVWAKSEVSRRGLTNVHFCGSHPVTAMPAFYASADVLLVSLKRDDAFERTIPGKIQSYMAAGKPILAMLDGEGARVVDEARAGFSCPAESPKALAEAAIRMASLPLHVRASMGSSGRDYYRENFEKNVLVERLLSWVEEVKESSSRTGVRS